MLKELDLLIDLLIDADFVALAEALGLCVEDILAEILGLLVADGVLEGVELGVGDGVELGVLDGVEEGVAEIEGDVVESN